MGKWFFLKRQRKQQTAIEAMEKLHGARVISREEENGVVRVKIVVSKRELKKMVASIGGERERSVAARHQMAAPKSLEELLHVIQRRHMEKGESEMCQLGEWQPALQTIPEES